MSIFWSFFIQLKNIYSQLSQLTRYFLGSRRPWPCWTSWVTCGICGVRCCRALCWREGRRRPMASGPDGDPPGGWRLIRSEMTWGKSSTEWTEWPWWVGNYSMPRNNLRIWQWLVVAARCREKVKTSQNGASFQNGTHTIAVSRWTMIIKHKGSVLN